MGKVLYIGFKGKNNASGRLAESLSPDHLLLTNSFEGLKRDIDSIGKEHDCAVMFGVDKNLVSMVRIELSAVNDDKKYYSKLRSDELAAALNAAGIKTVISDDPKTCLCNEAYWNVLSRFEGRAIFIHIPTIRNADEAFLSKMRQDYSIYL